MIGWFASRSATLTSSVHRGYAFQLGFVNFLDYAVRTDAGTKAKNKNPAIRDRIAESEIKCY